MKPAISHVTGMDARFEEEMAAAVPGWREIPPSFSADAVRHNGTAHRFELEIEGGLAFLDYRMDDAKMLLTHTFVPPELRGRKLAEQLVAAALKHARECRFRVVPQCGYVDAFLKRHPEFGDLRAA